MKRVSTRDKPPLDFVALVIVGLSVPAALLVLDVGSRPVSLAWLAFGVVVVALAGRSIGHEDGGDS